MNYHNAIKQLNLNHNFTQRELRLSYYKMALKFNPTYIRLGTILFGKRL